MSAAGWEPVIGLEIHVQLRTRTKMFCSCALSFGEEPNTRTCPVCLGLPGALPVTNAQAIHFGLMMALAFDCKVLEQSVFARKNYFYPDSPKESAQEQNIFVCVCSWTWISSPMTGSQSAALMPRPP